MGEFLLILKELLKKSKTDLLCLPLLDLQMAGAFPHSPPPPPPDRAKDFSEDERERCEQRPSQFSVIQVDECLLLILPLYFSTVFLASAVVSGHCWLRRTVSGPASSNQSAFNVYKMLTSFPLGQSGLHGLHWSSWSSWSSLVLMVLMVFSPHFSLWSSLVLMVFSPHCSLWSSLVLMVFFSPHGLL